MKRILLLALVPLALLTGCKANLGPGEAWYAYQNDQNNFARLQINGNVTGSTVRPGEVRNYPLLMSATHTIIVQRGDYQQAMNGNGDFYEDYVINSYDPPFTIQWVNDNWQQTANP
jgi:hypothetical protein